jgi:hypothetical protein
LFIASAISAWVGCFLPDFVVVPSVGSASAWVSDAAATLNTLSSCKNVLPKSAAGSEKYGEPGSSLSAGEHASIATIGIAATYLEIIFYYLFFL